MPTLVHNPEELQPASTPGEPRRLFGSELQVVATIVTLFSVAYFVDVLLRSSVKYFWYDELFTLYLSRLSMPALWSALKQGADFNPPLFYLLTKTSQAVFGSGRLGTRLPEMIGFWVLCLSLFRFVYRRAGIPAGVIAMLLPILSGAFYYSYEARPTALVLGFCGLALVCWQMSIEGVPRRGWLIAYSCFLFCAFMTHCYAVTLAIPFGLAELVRTARSRRIDWALWVALVLPAVLAGISFVPLFLAYASLSNGTNFQHMFPPSPRQLQIFYLFLLGPCSLLIGTVVIVLAIGRLLDTPLPDRRPGLGALPELTLAFSFISLPMFGILLGRVVHGPFFARYFVAAIAGVCIVIGLSAGVGKARNWVAMTLAVAFTCVAAWQVTNLVRHRIQNSIDLIPEPSSGFTENVTLGGPLSNYQILTLSKDKSLPIAVLEPLDFLYLAQYGTDLVSRLYFVAPARDNFFYRGFRLFRPWSAASYNPTVTFAEFVREHPAFLVFGASQISMITDFNQLGAETKSFKAANGRFLAELQR